MFEKLVILSVLLYSVWVFYFSRQILEETFSPRRTYLMILFTHVVIILGGRSLLPDGVLFILVHLASFLSIALFHYGSVKKKLFTYFLYTCTVMLMEMLIMCLYVGIQKLFFHSSKSIVAMRSVTSSTDTVCLFALMLTVGTLMFKLISDLAGIFTRYDSIKPLAQIFFPFYWIFIIFSMIIGYQLKFDSRLAVLFILSVSVIPIFLMGIKNLRFQERKRILRERQIELLKEQLDFFEDLTIEYQNLRKWNHDIENHLLSMNYLIKAGKYEETEKYLHNIMTTEETHL